MFNLTFNFVQLYFKSQRQLLDILLQLIRKSLNQPKENKKGQVKAMYNKIVSILVLLRFPVIIVLSLPFFLSVSQADYEDMFSWTTGLMYISLVICIYSGANGYNSYYDKDTGAIFCCEKPPKVSKSILYVSMSLKLLGVVLSGFVNWYFCAYCISCVLLSMSYSHPSIRLKARPIICWMMLGVLYHYTPVIFVAVGYKGLEGLTQTRIHLLGLILTGAGLAFTPVSQLFQFEEDGGRGEVSTAMMLGIKGSFIATWSFFICSGIGLMTFIYFYYPCCSHIVSRVALFSAVPGSIWLIIWTYLIFRIDSSHASSFRNANTLIVLYTAGSYIFVIWLIVYSYYYQI